MCDGFILFCKVFLEILKVLSDIIVDIIVIGNFFLCVLCRLKSLDMFFLGMILFLLLEMNIELFLVNIRDLDLMIGMNM